MIPVRTARSNFVYRGPTPDIGDAWVERDPARRVVFMEWQLEPGELELLNAGGLVRLGIYGIEPIPPVSLGISTEPIVTADEPPKGDLRGVFDRVEVRPGLASDDVATCRICGCTDLAACTPACWWVPDPAGIGDLCSSCVDLAHDQPLEGASA